MNVSLAERIGVVLGLAVRNVLFIAGWVALVWLLHIQMGGGFFGLVLAGVIVTVWMLIATRVVARVFTRVLAQSR